MANNKIILGNEVLIDLTDATITSVSEADKILSGYTAYGADGTKVTGTSTFDVDSSSVTATQAEVLAGKTFAKNGAVLTGTMPDRGGTNYTVDDINTPVTILAGYYDGSGDVSIDSDTLLPGNIKKDINILGVTGTYEGSGTPTSQSKTVTPSLTAQTVTPDTGYEYLSSVTVNAISVVRTQNAQGGTTVTIAGV